MSPLNSPTLPQFVLATIRRGSRPTGLIERQQCFGREIEFRWRRYFNSSVDSIRVWYNVTDAELAEARAVLRSIDAESIAKAET